VDFTIEKEYNKTMKNANKIIAVLLLTVLFLPAFSLAAERSKFYPLEEELRINNALAGLQAQIDALKNQVNGQPAAGISSNGYCCDPAPTTPGLEERVSNLEKMVDFLVKNVLGMLTTIIKSLTK